MFATVLIVLLTLTCLGWLWGVVCLARTLRDLPRLDDPGVPDPSTWPSLSMVVPACDEALTLPAAAATWRSLDLPALQVVLVDDRSRDATPTIVDELAADDPRLTAVHVRELPEGWLGKPHAMQRGLEQATGEWILFTDADVHLAPAALRRALALAEAEGLDFLAVLPDIPVGGVLLNATLGTFGRFFTVGNRLWKVADPGSDAAAGVGAFNLVRRAALERTPGLDWLRMDTTDDLALGLLMKRSGARCQVAWGTGLVSVKWYESLPAMVVGLEKNTFAMAGCSAGLLTAMAGAVLVMDLGPVAALLWPGSPTWLLALAALSLALGLGAGAWMARWARRPVLPSVLVPVGSLIVAWIFLRAGWLGWRRGGIRWRGTFHPTAELRAGRRVRML